MQFENPSAVRNGVLPEQSLQKMWRSGQISSHSTILADQFQPASLDLRLGDIAYRVRVSFLAGKDRDVKDQLQRFEMHRVNLSDGAVLEKGCVYVVPLQESLSLPTNVHAVANAKSSIGRLDVLTRLVTNQGTEFDRVEPGYTGPLFAEICPRSFSILVRSGSRMNQLRFRVGETVLSDSELESLHNENRLVSLTPNFDGGLGFSVDLGEKISPAGFRAKPHAGIIDIDRIGHYNPADFWEPVLSRSGQLILDPDSFYILVSREAVSIPPRYAAEMMPYIAMVGEFRVHYAGFFDPGFGYSHAGGTGSRSVLEVRCHEVPFLLEHGQTVGRLVYEKMADAPDHLYGLERGSNYQGQKLQLSKHFKEWRSDS